MPQAKEAQRSWRTSLASPSVVKKRSG